MTLLLLLAVAAPDATETLWLYQDGPSAGTRVRPWNMLWEEREQAGRRAVCCNDDHLAQPWAGINFQIDQGAPLRLTDEWLALGFVRYLANGGYDRYGSPNAELPFQLRPIHEGTDFQHVNTDFIDRGNGLDEDPGTWQEVLVPLRYWTDLKPGDELAGVSIQCVAQPSRSFAFAEVSLVRLAALPEWLRRADEPVIQPDVPWPTYDELPEMLRADRHPPRVVDGRFVDDAGRPVFVINPYCREDDRLDLWGSTDPARRAPALGLFDPTRHGWIYNDLLTAESLARLGFNSYSAFLPAGPWWDAVGYPADRREEDPALLAETYQRLKVPFYVDCVCFPWTLGAPASKPGETNLPAEAFTAGANHWVPYRIVGSGREAWLRLWRLYAQRYRDAGVPVLALELFNEPAYRDIGAGHLDEFAAWLQERYNTIEQLNATWRTEFTDWAQAAAAPDDRRNETVAGRFFDHDEYLSGRFNALARAGREAVEEILPQTVVGVQPMGGYAMEPRDAVWPHTMIRDLSIVLTPTGGGRWTPGGAASTRSANELDSPVAPAPIEPDLLQALAGGRMIFDNETYLSGQTAAEVRTRLWKQVFAGLDGLTVFIWSRRGWAWWGDAEQVRTEADKYPYSALIPYARRTAALRGIADFTAEVHARREAVLIQPDRQAPRPGLIVSWPQQRRRALEPGLPDKTYACYAALKYTHWQPAIVPSDAPDDAFDRPVLIAAGLRYADAHLLAKLDKQVEQGSTLIVTDEPMAQDIYGNRLDTAALLGLAMGDMEAGGEALIDLPDGVRLTGSISPLAAVRQADLAAGTDVLLRDTAGRPVVCRHRRGRGQVLVVLADLAGYRLARLLEHALTAAGLDLPLAADLRDTATGRLATNILVSLRGESLLLLNMDGYDKRATVTHAGGTTTVDLPAGAPVILN